MKVILIAGLGPGRMENEDLQGSGFNPDLDDGDKDDFYVIDGIDYDPRHLRYQHDEVDINVLREKKLKRPPLISSVLQGILTENNISYEYISTDNIWNRNNCNLKCDIVCLSTSYMWSEAMVEESISWINENIKYDKLIIGGQYASMKRNFLLNFECVDYVVVGDAEMSLVRLINYAGGLSDYETLVNIPNLIYRNENGAVVETEKISGDFQKYLPCKYYGDYDVITYMSMKSCPYSCEFCALRVSTPKWQYLSAERIIADWKKYKRENNVKHIDVNDSTFFVPFSRMQRLIQYLPELNLSWEANLRVDTPLDLDFIRKLEESHCLHLYFGFESMSDIVLKYMNKGTTARDNRHINDMFKTSGVDTMMSFIVGFPGETPEHFKETKDYLLNEHYGHFNIYVFEFEDDDSMPIWKNRDRFELRVINESRSQSKWQHSGESWTHMGMDSKKAKKLRADLIKDSRCSGSTSIHKTWQYQYEWPFIVQLSRSDNLKIEKLIDRLIFVMIDYKNKAERKKIIYKILADLKEYNIYFDN